MKKLILLLCFCFPAFATLDFTVTTPTSYIGAGTPSRAITLTVTGGTTGSTTTFTLTDGGASGTFYVAAAVTTVTIGAAGTSTQFVYLAAPAAAGTITLQVVATGGISATHTIALPIGVATKFAYDTYGGAAATNLLSHTPDIGATWLKPFTSGTINKFLNGSVGAYDSGTGFVTADFIIPTAIPTLEHDTTVTISNINTTTSHPDVSTFVSNTNAAVGYRFVISGGQYYFIRYPAGTVFFGPVGSVTTGSTHTLAIAVRVINSLQYEFPLSDGVVINGVVQDSGLTSGYSGHIAEIPSGQTPASTSAVFTNFIGSNADWGPLPVLTTFPNANVYQSPYTWRNASGAAICPTGGCYFKFNMTTGSGCGTSCSLALNVDTTINSSLSANDMPAVKTVISTAAQDGLFLTNQFPANNAANTLVTISGTLSASTTYSVIVYGIGGNQASGDGYAGTTYQTKINNIQIDGGGSLAAVTPRPNLCYFGGASYEQGYFGATVTGAYYTYVDQTHTWALAVSQATALNCEYGLVGVGGQGFQNSGQGGYPSFPSSYDHYDSTHTKTLTGATYAIIHQAENDHSYSTGSETTAVQSWIAAARTAFGSSTKIFLVGALHGTHTTGISAGVTNAADPLVYWISPGTQFVNTVFAGAASFGSPDGLHLYDYFQQGIYGTMIVAGVEKALATTTGSGPGPIVIQ